MLAITQHEPGSAAFRARLPKAELSACSEVALLDPANLYNARALMSAQEIAELYERAY